MTVIEKFSPEVCKELKCYVYRLIDPRNGQTFYVGKGTGNRVFDHANGALKNYDIDSEHEDSISLKIQTIRDIHLAGLKVIHLIHRYGLDKDTAYEVESAVMDCYYFDKLTNIQNGHANDRGVVNSLTLQQNLSIETYDEIDSFKYMIVKTKWDRVNEIKDSKPSLTKEECIYEATRASWKINLDRANHFEYAFGVIDGIVEGIYKIKEWVLSDNGIRYEFIKDEINPPEEILKHFLGKRIPNTYIKRGQANPIMYHE